MQILAETFFQGYRRVDLKPHEILLRVKLPWTREHEYVKEFKQSHRQDDDIAIVNAGMRVQLEPSESGTVMEQCVYQRSPSYLPVCAAKCVSVGTEGIAKLANLVCCASVDDRLHVQRLLTLPVELSVSA